MVIKIGKFISGVEEKYPKELLEGRLTVEGNVIASLFLDPLMIDECDLKTTDFITADGVFYFSLAKKLRTAGFAVFDEVTILSTVSDNIAEAFQERGGYETIKNLTEIVNIKNAEVYLDNLYRENILLKLHTDGFNLFNEVEWNNKEQRPIDIFRKMNSENVTDWYESRLCGYENGKSSAVLEEEMLDFDDDFIENCLEGEENGTPFETAGIDVNGEEINCYPFLSRQTSGLLHGTMAMIGGFSSAGKSTWLIGLIMGLLASGEKVIIVSNEESIKKYKTKFMVWLLAKRNRYYSLSKKKLMAGDLSDEDKKQLKYVQQYWRDNYKNNLKLVTINDSDFRIAKKKIREAALTWGASAFVVDTFKIQMADMENARQDLALVRDSRDLQKLAAKYDMIGIAAVQLAERERSKLFLDSSVLSNSKQIKEVLEYLFLMRPVYNTEEFDPKSKLYCRPFRYKKVGDKWVEEEYEPDISSTWRMLFVEKNRNGNDTASSSTAYLLRFDGDHALFRESCMCRPRHGRLE